MKKKFNNLGLDDALSDFVTGNDKEEKPPFNPLTDKKPRQKRETPKIDEENSASVQKIEKKTPGIRKENKPQTKPQVKIQNISTDYDLSKLPNDFRSHSALFSAAQRAQLREIVYYKKWKENPKFTIQLAIYQALEEFFGNRQSLTYFPDDFEPYSPGFSISQWERLEAVVAEIKYKENKGYGLKYAIYEALKIYIELNPINS